MRAALLLACLAAGSLRAAPALTLPEGGRAAAMAGSLGAAWGESAALGSNPAALARFKGLDLGAQALRWPEGGDLGGFSIAAGPANLQLRRFQSQAEGRDRGGNPTGSLNWYSDHLRLGFGQPLNESLDFGLAYEGANEQLAAQSAGASFSDSESLASLGLLWHSGGLGLGAALLHQPFLPKTSRYLRWEGPGTGDSSRVEIQAAWSRPKRLLISQAVMFDLYYHRWEWAAGLEGALSSGASGLAMRMGYSSRFAELGPLSGFSLGFGFRHRAFSLDYAWLPLPDLGSLSLFSLNFRLD